MKTTIDPNVVEQVFLDCLFRSEEIVDGKTPEGAVIAEGIMAKVPAELRASPRRFWQY